MHHHQLLRVAVFKHLLQSFDGRVEAFIVIGTIWISRAGWVYAGIPPKFVDQHVTTVTVNPYALYIAGVAGVDDHFAIKSLDTISKSLIPASMAHQKRVYGKRAVGIEPLPSGSSEVGAADAIGSSIAT